MFSFAQVSVAHLYRKMAEKSSMSGLPIMDEFLIILDSHAGLQPLLPGCCGFSSEPLHSCPPGTPLCPLEFCSAAFWLQSGYLIAGEEDKCSLSPFCFPGTGFSNQRGKTPAPRHAGNQSCGVQRNRALSRGKGQETSGRWRRIYPCWVMGVWQVTVSGPHQPQVGMVALGTAT